MLRWITVVLSICTATIVHAQQPLPFPGKPPHVLPRRIALVIGVENYSGGGAVQLDNLPGAANDARNMAEVLGKYGFEVKQLLARPPSKWVIRDDIIDAITDLVSAAKDARLQSSRGAIVVFYFAGHGLRANDKNYLLPSRFSATYLENVPEKAIELEGMVANAFGAADIAPELKIVIVDACRTATPATLPSQMGGGLAKLGRGIVNPSYDSSGFELGKNHNLFLFAALPGNAAFDGDIGGQFTTRLVDAMTEQIRTAQQNSAAPSKTLNDLFQQIKTFMMAASIKKQIPQMDDRYASPFYPLPTERDFAVEEASFAFVNDVPLANFKKADDVLVYQACEFTKLLTNFSQYSYFSADIIQKINARGSCPNPAESRSTRGNDGRWILVPPQDPGAPPVSAPIRTPSNSSGSGFASSPRFSSGSSASTDISAVSARPPRIILARDEPRKEFSKEPDTPPLAPITFGDLRALLSTLPPDAMPTRLPDDAVPLNRTVVAKGKTNIRKGPGPGQDLVSTVAAGDFLEVVRATKGRTWLEVRHPLAGQGYVSGDLVEPALVNVSKTVAFDAAAFEPTKEVLVDLTAALGTLGGIAIVDGWVSYPPIDTKIGFARAAGVRSFVQSLLAPPEKGGSRVYIKLNESNKSDLPSGKVLVTLLGLPLNQSVRAAIAQTVDSNSGVLLDLDSSRLLPDSELPPDRPSPPPVASICTQESQCTTVPSVIKPAELKESLGQVMNVKPPMKESPVGVEGIRNTLKLLRF